MVDKKGRPVCADHHELVGDVKILKYVLGVKDKSNGERDKQIEELKHKAESIEEHSIAEYKTLYEKIDTIYNEVETQKGIREGIEKYGDKNYTRIYALLVIIISVTSVILTILNNKGWI